MGRTTYGQIVDSVRDDFHEPTAAFLVNSALLGHCRRAEIILATEAGVIREFKTIFTTVTDTMKYSLTTDIIGILHMVYGSAPVQKANWREWMDATSYKGDAASTTGTPYLYTVFGPEGEDGTVRLYPIPDSASAVVAWRTKLPSKALTSYTTGLAVEVPEKYAHLIELYVLYRANSKGKSAEEQRKAQLNLNLWQQGLEWAKKVQKAEESSDRFSVVRDADWGWASHYGPL